MNKDIIEFVKLFPVLFWIYIISQVIVLIWITLQLKEEYNVD